MKISDLINRLEQIKEVEGDLECVDRFDYEFENESLIAEKSDRLNRIVLYVGE